MVEETLTKLKSLVANIDEKIVNRTIALLTDEFEEEYLADCEQEVEFLSLVTIASYNDLFDNDKNVENKQFGYSGLVTIVETMHDVERKSTTKEGEVTRVRANLLANLRGISAEDYVEQGYFEKDLEFIQVLLEDSNNEDGKSTLETQIEQNEAIQSAVSRTVTSILSVYEQVMAGGFEIEPYFGVSTLRQDIGSIKIENNKAKVYPSVALKGLASILNKSYKVEVDTGRQFNMDNILSSEKPVYYPFKIAEYLYGRVSTKNLKSLDYARFDGGSGWDNYASDYIIPNLKYFLNQGIKVVCEREGFVSDGELAFNDEFSDIQTIKGKLKKMERSLVTMAIIPELESTSSTHENWSSIKLRLVETSEQLPSNQRLIGEVIDKLMDGLGSASGQEFSISPETVDDLASYRVFEYEHIFDSKMANLRPLFAYQALDALQSKGETVDWSNIILGKGMNGKTVTSKAGGAINLSDQLIHNLIAGSRSGKGVMTLNILSTAIASNRPVFYQDRKPDMAALFAEYVGLNNSTPNMYIVNGSAYEGRFDPSGVLNYDNMTSKWQDKVPAWWDATSYKDIGDVVYYRGIMFTLGILLLRFWAETSDRALYDKLGGDGGIAIIYDEFTNWQVSFSSKKLNPRGANSLFGKDMLLNKKSLEEIMKAQDELDDLESSGEELGSRQKSTLRNANNVLRDLKQEKRAYVSDLLDNLDRTLLTLNEKKNAGFKNTEEKRSDIFVIGQNVEVKPIPEGITFSRNQASGGLNADKSYENTCAVSTFLYNFSTDWFMGYNADYPNYMRAGEKSSPSFHRLTAEARNFAYYKGSRDAVMGAMQVSTVKSNAKFFKPYLILNNAKEPKPLSDNPEERKAQCQQSEYQYVGGVILNTGKEWDKIRKQNLQEGTDELRPEIGFFDYLNQLSKGAGTNVDPKAVLGKSKEIADMVVQGMGYDGDYLDFLMDLRPEWNFGAQDIVDAFATPEVFSNGTKRMPTFINLFGNPKGTESSEDVDDEAFNLGSVGDEDDKEYLDLDTVGDEADTEDDYQDEDELSIINESDSVPDDNLDLYKGVGDIDSESLDSNNDGFGFNTGIGANVGVVDPFSDDISNVSGLVTEGVQSATDLAGKGIDAYSKMSTDDLLKELSNRGINTDDLKAQTENEQFGSANVIEDIGKPVEVKSTNGFARVEPMSMTAKTEEDYYTNYFEFCERVTNDIVQSFGGLDGIEVMIIKDGTLYINNVKYNKKFPQEVLNGLPLDKKAQISNGNFAHVFNFAYLTKMPRLAYLSIDSKDFAYIKLRQDLKIGSDFGIMTIFHAIPPLYYLTIAGTRYDRDTVEIDEAKNASVFRSAKKREMVSQSIEDAGVNSVNKSWDSTKNMYQRKGWGWKLGGTAMLGVTAVAGAGVLGLKGFKELKRGVKEMFKG